MSSLPHSYFWVIELVYSGHALIGRRQLAAGIEWEAARLQATTHAQASQAAGMDCCYCVYGNDGLHLTVPSIQGVH